jgi:hypothetical protein
VDLLADQSAASALLADTRRIFQQLAERRQALLDNLTSKLAPDIAEVGQLTGALSTVQFPLASLITLNEAMRS